MIETKLSCVTSGLILSQLSKWVRPLLDKYVPTFRRRVTREAEMHSDTNRTWLERPFSSFEFWIDLNRSHSWPCRGSPDYFFVNAVRPSTLVIYEAPLYRWYAGDQRFSHFTPECRMHASAKFEVRANKNLAPPLHEGLNKDLTHYN